MALRKYPGIAYGSQQYIKTGNDHVLLVRYDWKGQSIFIVHNFNLQQQQITRQLEKGGSLLPVLTSLEKPETSKTAQAKFTVSLERYGYRGIHCKLVQYRDAFLKIHTDVNIGLQRILPGLHHAVQVFRPWWRQQISLSLRVLAAHKHLAASVTSAHQHGATPFIFDHLFPAAI